MSAAGISPRNLRNDPAPMDGVAARLRARFPGFEPDEGWARTADRYPARASAEYLELIQRPLDTDPVFRQTAPAPEELGPEGEADPVAEADFEAAPGLLHRFPDRALVLVTPSCFVHCRHCMRKRNWTLSAPTSPLGDRLPGWRRYLLEHTKVREIVLSGGDPLTLSDADLAAVLQTFAGIGHVRTLRIHSRAPVVAPSRVTPRLARVLAEGKVTRLVTQANHPVEISEGMIAAVDRLLAEGVAVENQSVLLAGVNDRAEVLAELVGKLNEARVRPYYLHHPDPVRGAMHFYVDLNRGWEIYQRARRLAPGLTFPDYVADRPGTEGKIKVERLVAKKR